MACILTIDTSGDEAGICLAQDDLFTETVNPKQQDHAAWLQPAIRQLLQAADRTTESLDAIAVVAGPGSYTGLRVGMASAKGLCYVLDKPLILMGSLEIMARAAMKQTATSRLLCPMIDARRMEVYTAVYDGAAKELEPPHALVLEPGSFDKWLESNDLLFFGNGSGKYKSLLKCDQAVFENIHSSIRDAASLAAEMYHRQAFADLAYAEPFYVKAFYTPVKAKT